MATKYDLSDLPNLGILNPLRRYNKAHTFNSSKGYVMVHTYPHIHGSYHLKKIALMVSAHSLLHSLIAMINEEEQRIEEINAINENMGLPPIEEGQILKNAKVAINSALGLKQENATVQNIG